MAFPGKISDFKRVVVKVGSSLVTEGGGLRELWMGTLAEDMARMQARGASVILVTSGAVALGRDRLGVKGRALKLEEKQAAAACGQIRLVQAWREHFARHDLETAQLLLTIDDSEDRRRYLNARNTLEMLLQHRVIPVINENDTVATAELRFGDNDRLAARVAQMASADLLVLLSDIDGLYTMNPRLHPEAQFIPLVRAVTPLIEAMAGGASSQVGTGGMVTKIQAAKIALAAGCHMMIAAGDQPYPLSALEKGGRATLFLADSNPLNARKHWIGGSIAPSGVVTVDAGAQKALENGKSLLPAGVTAVRGDFGRGDAVAIENAEGLILGKGLIAYAREDAMRIIGHNSEAIEAILGYKGRSVLIHCDDIALASRTGFDR